MVHFSSGIILHSAYGFRVRDGGIAQTVRSLSLGFPSTSNLHPSRDVSSPPIGLTMLVGAADVDSTLKPKVTNVIAETFVKAPFYSPPMMKVMGADKVEPFLMHTYYTDQWPYLPEVTIEQYGKPQPKRFKDFINE